MPGAKESVPVYVAQGFGFTLGSAGPSERAKSVAIISLAKFVKGSAEPLMISTTAFWGKSGGREVATVVDFGSPVVCKRLERIIDVPRSGRDRERLGQ